jgi:hypothetical protein
VRVVQTLQDLGTYKRTHDGRYKLWIDEATGLESGIKGEVIYRPSTIRHLRVVDQSARYYHAVSWQDVRLPPWCDTAAHEQRLQ